MTLRGDSRTVGKCGPILLQFPVLSEIQVGILGNILKKIEYWGYYEETYLPPYCNTFNMGT